MQFELPTTKDDMYAVLGELFYYYRVKKDPYQEVELLELNIDRQVFEPKTYSELLERAKDDLRADQIREINEYKAGLEEQIRALSIKSTLLQAEKEKLKSDLQDRYLQSSRKIEQTIQKNGLIGSSIALTQISAIESEKNKEITGLETRIATALAEYQSQIAALEERKNNAQTYFNEIHQKQAEKRAKELEDAQDKIEREVFKYNNSLSEKEQRYSNSLAQIRANAEARYQEMKVVDYSRDQLVEMGYYRDAIECISYYYDNLNKVDAYEDFIESEKRLMLYLDDFYMEMLYRYKLRAYPE